MTALKYRILIDRRAQDDLNEFYEYLREYSESTALKYVEAFYDAVDQTLAEFPHSCAFLPEIGAPYRGLLFRVSKRTAFWVIFTVHDETHEVRILRFWNAAREPGTHGVGA